MLEVILETIVRKFSGNGIARTAGTCAGRIAALQHKAADHTMEDNTIIVALVYQGDKVVDCVWCNIRI